MTDKDELAALKARVAELERAAKPPAPPDPKDWEPVDYTARMSISPQVARDMAAAIPDHIVKGIVRDNQAPTGPSSAGAIPSSQQVSNVRGSGGLPNTSGWREATPLSNPPGVNWVDAIAIADDVRQRLGKK